VVDKLEEVHLREQLDKWPSYIKAGLDEVQKARIHGLLHEFEDCFAWTNKEMLGLNRDLVADQEGIQVVQTAA
jgi:hypothetical protein